jgi:hypothetical protein
LKHNSTLKASWSPVSLHVAPEYFLLCYFYIVVHNQKVMVFCLVYSPSANYEILPPRRF